MILKLRKKTDDSGEYFQEYQFFKLEDISYCLFTTSGSGLHDHSIYILLKNGTSIQFYHHELMTPSWQSLNDRIFGIFSESV